MKGRFRLWFGAYLVVKALVLYVLFAPAVHAQIQPFSYWVPPSNCVSAVSGNSTGTNGATIIAASGLPVVQASTSNSGTNTHTYTCNLAPPQWLGATGTRIQVVAATFFYGVVPTSFVGSLGTQAAVLASGTFNGSIVFRLIAYPTPGAAEVPSTIAPVRADSGNLVITPVAASFNLTSTTSGQFYSAKFQPATPINWNTDLRQLIMTVTFQGAATTATITNSPGIIVYVRSQ